MNGKINNTNRNGHGKKKEEEEKKKSEFEFCKVCRVNHDDGSRHKYLPRHKQSLSAFLARFQNKLADVRFFVRNPSLLLPEHASRNRLWCVFCDADLLELDSQFACGNAINHLAGADHLKNLKHFLWINGGGMDRVDAFRISEADVAKWEKKCKSLTDGALSGDELRRQVGPSNDIHNELEQNNENINNFERNYVFDRISSNLSNAVVPLQYYTNEHQISYSGVSADANVGQFTHKTISDLPVDVYSGTDFWSSNDLAGHGYAEHCLGYKTTAISNNLISGESNQVDREARILNGASCAQGLQTIPGISGEAHEKSRGNVHTGAPPPWLEAIEEDHKPISSSSISLPNKHKKSQKLNPKRVGAAWAEKRKIELEMEKRGDIVKNDCDANWLPNFGRVWQSGSRKESRKEFEMEKKKLPNVENYSEVRHNVPHIDGNLEEPVPLQPYISKRTRMASQKKPKEGFEEEQKFPLVESHSEEKQKLAIRSQSEVPILLQPYISKRMKLPRKPLFNRAIHVMDYYISHLPCRSCYHTGGVYRCHSAWCLR